MVKSSTEFIALKADTTLNTLEIQTRFLISQIPSSFLNAGTIEVGNKCAVAKVGNVYYSLGTSISVIKNFQQQPTKAYSDSLYYIIVGNTLYDLSSGTLKELKVLDQSQNYEIYNYLTRLALVAQNNTAISSTFNVQMTVNLFSLTPNLTDIANFKITSTGGPISTLVTKISPQLTKLHIQYYQQGQKTELLRDVDYSLSLSTIV